MTAESPNEVIDLTVPVFRRVVEKVVRATSEAAQRGLPVDALAMAVRVTEQVVARYGLREPEVPLLRAKYALAGEEPPTKVVYVRRRSGEGLDEHYTLRGDERKYVMGHPGEGFYSAQEVMDVTGWSRASVSRYKGLYGWRHVLREIVGDSGRVSVFAFYAKEDVDRTLCELRLRKGGGAVLGKQQSC